VRRTLLKKILVAYDNGTKAKKALETALEIAKGCQAEICLATSVKLPELISSVTSSDLYEDLEEQTRQFFTDILKEAEAQAVQAGVPVSSVILKDRPGEALIRLAEQEQFDLIAIGSANRSAFERAIMGLGSVSNYVLHHAKCPVLVIKD